MVRRLDRLFKAATRRIEIVQSVKHASGVNQSVNVLVRIDPDLRRATDALVLESSAGEAAFRRVTDWLQDRDLNLLSPEQADLAAAWLRIVVAQEHIRLGRRWCSERDFGMYMLDTSFIDQPDKAWTTIEEFLRVVDEDGRLATERRSHGYQDSVLRVFFVPNGEFIVASAQYVTDAIRAQVARNITACISRYDLAIAEDARLVGDGFCIANRVVCEIEKPSWRFAMSDDRGSIGAFIERVRRVAEAEYSVIVRSDSVKYLDDFLLGIAVLE